MAIAWFYIDISYASQAFGFHNFEANPDLLGKLDFLDIVIGVIIIAIILKWGWFKHERNNRLPRC